MSSKKLLNNPSNSVPDALQGLAASCPNLSLLKGQPVVLRTDMAAIKGKVALLSGGGSGHEPAHGGLVGDGMLTGAVCGAVFTSPPVGAILAALRAIWRHGSPSGVLVIIKNYTGDRINFGLALERARAEGVLCDLVAVADDCALTSSDRSAGRRGLAGTLLVHKVAGAMAREGKALQEIVSYLNDKVLSQMATIGLSLSPCCLPGSDGPSFTLGQDEMELGLGIHGEAGAKRMKLQTASASVDIMLDHMTDPNSVTKLEVSRGQDVVVLLNNLGGTSNLEMLVLCKSVLDSCKKRGWVVKDFLSGAMMTALDMAGVSITVLKVNDAALVDRVNADVSAPGWTPKSLKAMTGFGAVNTFDSAEEEKAEVKHARIFSTLVHALAHKSVEFACEALKSCERQLNTLDSGAGDGDCGATLKRGAEKLLSLAEGHLTSTTAVFDLISGIAEEEMGGSAGAMYSILFATAATALRETKKDGAHPEEIVSALHKGVDAMMKYGGAKPGDRTMIDAILPALEAFKEHFTGTKQPLQALEKATDAAEKGAIATLAMKAKAGRASYVAQSELKHPDAGAHAVGIIFRAVYQAMLKVCSEKGYTE